MDFAPARIHTDGHKRRFEPIVLDLEHTRNIGISAHIDSGKTTLTERVLFYAGRIHKIEEVKGKSGAGATMDSMDLERERGITIQSAATHVTWGDYHFNIIDTPGHVDFTVEVERALSVLDGAVLVLCAVGGVQSQSLTVDRQMRRYKVPRVAFINKMDRSGADPFGVTEQLRSKLGHNAVLVNIPIGSEDDFEGVVDLATRRAIYFDGDNGETVREEDCPEELADLCEEYRSKLVEAVAELDEELLEKFVSGDEVSAEEIEPVIRRATLTLELTPVFCGSAFKNKGVQTLLDGVVAYLPDPAQVTNTALDLEDNEAEVELSHDPEAPLCALAFKIEDGRYGQLTYVRVYQGTLSKGLSIFNMRDDKKIKVGRLVRMHADNMEDIEAAGPGDIVALFGVDCASGDTFTDGQLRYSMRSMYVPEPVIRYAVFPRDKAMLGNFAKALGRFTKEDPTFRVRRDEESGETILAGMGELHLDVYIERMRREYKVDVIVGPPQVAYRETITKEIELDYTHRKQTGGAGQYARVVAMLRPLEVEDGAVHYRFLDQIKGGRIPREYIPACDRGFRRALEQGPLIGFPVTDIEVELTDGNSHAVDSSDMAFFTCAHSALKGGLKKAKPEILEPTMKVEVEVPEEFLGVSQATLVRRRGTIVGTGTTHGSAVVEAHVPLAEMFGYSTELRSVTQGKGEFTMEFLRYGRVPASVEKDLVEKNNARSR